MNVNALGPMHLTKAFYSTMLEKGGHITNIASIAGLGPSPRMVDYCASKHAVVGFSRGLQYEHDCSGIKNVKVTTIFPHLMNTGMFNNCTVKLSRVFPAIEPDYAANQVLFNLLILFPAVICEIYLDCMPLFLLLSMIAALI